MEKYLSILKTCDLFSGIQEEKLIHTLKCMQAHILTYGKNQTIINFHDTIDSIGIILSGSIIICHEDLEGNRNIIAHFTKGEVFSESLAILKYKAFNSIIANDNTEIIFVKMDKILTPCYNFCSYHLTIIQNLVGMLARKNYLLNQKIEHITKKTIKEKILSYLSSQSKINKSKSFYIPFNRQELADYLNVERSALSKELSQLQAQNRFTYHKNHFILK